MVDAEGSEEQRAWRAVARAPFVALTTYRRSGAEVTTPVWIAPDGESLVVTTEAAVGKVKRLRNDPHVRLQPCSRLGRIEEGSSAVDARCVLMRSPAEHPAGNIALRRKYGVQFTVVLAVERWIRRLQRKDPRRLILRLERDSDARSPGAPGSAPA